MYHFEEAIHCVGVPIAEDKGENFPKFITDQIFKTDVNAFADCIQ
jgi:hypothetical protein